MSMLEGLLARRRLNGHPQQPAAAGEARHDEPPRLDARRDSWYVKQVGHTFAAVGCDNYGRLLGLAVVILSTVVGTSVFTALGDNPSTWAKVLVGTLSVMAALAAAVKEHMQFGKRSADHIAAAAVYEQVRYEADQLDDELQLGVIGTKAAENRLEKLEAKAEEQDAKPIRIPQRTYNRAEAWVQRRALGRRQRALELARLG